MNNKSRTETEPIGAEDSAKRYQLSNKLDLKNEVDLTVAELNESPGGRSKWIRT